VRLSRSFLAPILIALMSSSIEAQTPFTEEAIARGVYFVPSWGHWTPPWGVGMALNDLDGDGDVDMVLIGDVLGTVRVLENDGTGTFLNPPVASDYPQSINLSGVSCADYDGDGDLDLFFTLVQEANRLYRNDGGFEFTDVTDIAGVGDPGNGEASCWGDFDGDGWLDLYVTNRNTLLVDGAGPLDLIPNRLYRNLGDGTFEEVSAIHGVDDPNHSFQAMFFDHDLDGDLDLYLSNDKGSGIGNNHNRLWRNDDGAFVEISVESGANAAIDSMGLDIADFDRDGDFDIYCTNVPTGNVLYLSNGDGTYTESADLAGVAAYVSGWTALFWDFDNDAFTDLHVGNSLVEDHLYRHEGVWPAVDVAPLFEIEEPGLGGGFVDTYGGAVADIDLDGDLDLVITAWNAPVSVYINHEGTERNWLRIRPRALSPNRFGIGSTAIVRSGEVEQIQQLSAGRGYKSSSELVLHFGLDEADTVDEIVIRWPNSDLTTLTNLTANQEIEVDQALVPTAIDCNRNFIPDFEEIAADATLDENDNGLIDDCETEPAPFERGDVNGDGGLDVGDPIAALGYLFTSEPVGCLDAVDANDDGSVDIADPISLLTHLFDFGPPPAGPWPDCGEDPSEDDLSCYESTCD